MTIRLPEGHRWEEVESGAAQVFAWECVTCGSSFTHDVESQTTQFDEVTTDCWDTGASEDAEEVP